MRSSSVKAVVGLVVLVAAGALFVALRDEGDESGGESTAGTPSTTSKQTAPAPTITIKGGEPVGGVKELTYSEGDLIRFRVTSDVSDEIHVHGYDLMKEVEAGGSVSFDFPADIAGIFEAELEGRGVQIAEIRVNP